MARLQQAEEKQASGPRGQNTGRELRAKEHEESAAPTSRSQDRRRCRPLVLSRSKSGCASCGCSTACTGVRIARAGITLEMEMEMGCRCFCQSARKGCTLHLPFWTSQKISKKRNPFARQRRSVSREHLVFCAWWPTLNIGHTKWAESTPWEVQIFLY